MIWFITWLAEAGFWFLLGTPKIFVKEFKIFFLILKY